MRNQSLTGSGYRIPREDLIPKGSYYQSNPTRWNLNRQSSPCRRTRMESSHAGFFFSVQLSPISSLHSNIDFFSRTLPFLSPRKSIDIKTSLCVSPRQVSKEIQLGVRLVYVEKFTVDFPFFRKAISSRLIAVAGCSMLSSRQRSDRDRFSGSTAFLVSI